MSVPLVSMPCGRERIEEGQLQAAGNVGVVARVEVNPPAFWASGPLFCAFWKSGRMAPMSTWL